MLSQQESEIEAPPTRPRVVIIGAGIAGLAAANRLMELSEGLDQQPEIIVLEGSPKPGGVISTYNLDDTIIDLGPDSFITQKPGAIKLCERLGLSDHLIHPNPQNRRTFVAHNGKLVPLPDGFFMMAPTQIGPILQSPLFSLSAKLRMGMDFILPKASPEQDESVSQFVARRFGQEVLERVAQPLLGGIYCGDTDELSMKHSLPRLWELEQQYGSVIRGLAIQTAGLKGSQQSGARYSMFATLDQGLMLLVQRLVERLPQDALKTHALVSQIRRSMKGRRWEVTLYDRTKILADGIIIATAAHHAGDILGEAHPGVARALRRVESSSSVVLNLIYKREDIPHPLDGFGFVVPKTERGSILACSFTSVKWAHRAPKDRVQLRVFMGGTLDPEMYEFSDEQVECLMWNDLNRYLGIEALPLMSVISRYPRSMPQYKVGHGELLKTVNEGLKMLRGVALCGNAYSGVGLPDCISSGEAAAESIVTNVLQQYKATV